MAIEWSHLDTSFGALIRSGAGIIELVLAAFVLAKTPRTRASIGLGLFMLADGIGYIVYALAGGFSRFPHKDLVVPAFTVTPVLSVIAAGSLLAYAWPEVRRLTETPMAAVAAAVAFAATAGLTPFLVFVLGAHQPLEEYGTWAGVRGAELDAAAFSLYTATAAAVVVAFVEGWRRRPGSPSARAQLLLAALLLMAGLTTAVSVNLALAANGDVLRASNLSETAGWTFVAAAVLYLPVAFWLLRSPRGGTWPRRTAVAVMLVALAVMVVEFVLLLGDLQDHGFGGIVTLLGLAVFAVALFRLDLLGGPVPRPRTGFLAALGLAALFSTAQVAQNFLSDGLGLLWGGIVAGVVVFAAGPLQRRMERTTQAPAGDVAAKYRRLVETAWTDGKLGANERLLLAESRRQLGLDAEAAATIDEDVARKHARGDA